MKKFFVVFAALVLAFSVLPVTAVETGTGVGVDVTVEKFDPLVWMCDHRVVLDDNVEPGKVSPGGVELVERLENYAFEGEQIHWKVLVMDKNGIEKLKDVFVTVGEQQVGGNPIEANCKLGEVLNTADPIPESCNARILEEEVATREPDITLEELGNGEAFEGESIKLVIPDNPTGKDFAGFDVSTSVLLKNISSISYDRRVTQFDAGWSPLVVLGIDSDGDGVFEAQPLEWEASGVPGPNNASLLGDDTFIQCEAEVALSGTDANFVNVDAYNTFKCYTPNAAGTGYDFSVYAPLSYFQSNTVGRADPDDRVRMVKVMLGGNPSTQDNEIAYVDNLEVNGNLLSEPIDGRLALYDCTLTVETPESMDGEYWVTVEAEDLDGGVGSMDEKEFWFFNPEIALAINGVLAFDEVRPGSQAYSNTLLVKNDAELGSGVMMDMFVSGTDFYDSSSSGAKCPTTNQLALTNFDYFASNGAYSTQDDSRADTEGYVGICYGNTFQRSMYNTCEIIHSVLNTNGYHAGNILSPGAGISMTFRLSLPEPCNGNFDSGQIFFWGEAV